MVRSILTKRSKENESSEDDGGDGSKLSHDVFFFYFLPFLKRNVCVVWDELSLKQTSIYNDTTLVF